MSDFSGMEDLLQDFLVEAGDLLSGVDNKLVDLERSPADKSLLNDIFRGFHAAFPNVVWAAHEYLVSDFPLVVSSVLNGSALAVFISRLR